MPQRSAMPQRRPCSPSSILLGAMLAAACSSNESGAEMASSSTDPNLTPDGSGENGDRGQMSAEPSVQGGTPPGSMLEGPPTNVGVAPPSMPSDPAAEPPGEDPDAPEQGGASPPVPSAGCGSTAPVASGRFTIDVAGAARDYILELPDDYDASRPYRVIFGWHPRGGSAEQVANGFGGGFYGLEQLADGSAIFVSPEGIDEGWANTGGRDIAFLDAMLGRLEAELCMDESRIFSTGFSYGGMMSFAVGCARGDVFRAIAPMAGALYSGCADGDAPIAVLGFHGISDTVVPLANGATARNVFVERNGCEPQEMGADELGCRSFAGCADGFPITWCQFAGGHTPAPASAQPIWDFFMQF
jgi:polyhydroxybutyrate depolymerase